MIFKHFENSEKTGQNNVSTTKMEHKLMLLAGEFGLH